MLRHMYFVIAGTAGLTFAQCAFALPREGFYVDGPDCDNHGQQGIVDELGTGSIFETLYPDELIFAGSTVTDQAACPGSDNPQVPNVIVRMTNLTDRAFTDLFYVGDSTSDPGAGPQTFLSNDDGGAVDLTGGAGGGAAGLAFKIDNVGLNRPLLSESVLSDHVFSPGETWEFIIDDYSNVLGLPPEAMGSPGFASLSGGTAPDMSSGSIVVLVPEPAIASTAFLLALPMLMRRFRR